MTFVGHSSFALIEYNGIQFDGASTVTISVENVTGSDPRAIVARRHTFTVAGVIQDDKSTDPILGDLRARISENGRPFHYLDSGFGGRLSVNSELRADTEYDIANGPIVAVLEWEPIGGHRACQVQLRFVITLPPCGLASGDLINSIMEWSYTYSLAIDKHSDTTRTISGVIRAPKVAQGPNARSPVDGGAHRFFLAAGLSVIPPTGFSRENFTSTTNEDDSELRYTIVDKQIPTRNPYPVNVTEITGKHRVSWSWKGHGDKMAMKRHRNMISMDITPRSNITGSVAWVIFLQVVQERIRIAATSGRLLTFNALDVTEELWGRLSSISCEYVVLGEVRDFIGDMGLWVPISGMDWRAWRTSLTNAGIQTPHGSAQLREEDSDRSVVVHLCDDGDRPHITDPGAVESRWTRRSVVQKLRNEKPPPEKSYADYQMNVIPLRQRPVQRQSILQPPDTEPGATEASPGDSTPSPVDAIRKLFTGETTFSFGDAQGTPDIIQEGGVSRYGVILSGRATRIGYEVPRPRIETIGDKKAVEVKAYFNQTQAANLLGVTAYEAEWVILYAVGASPGEVESSIHGKLDEGIDADGNANV